MLSAARCLAISAAFMTMAPGAAPVLAKDRVEANASMPIAAADIDETANRALAAFQVPGMAVGIVKDGKLIFARGYGVREVGKPERVDPDTLFQIGSNTKAFTSAALAMLVDEGKISWDDKVIDYLPEFRLYDPYVTREFTIRDLLTHRSGLGTGAGDLMFYPATDMTRDEVIRGLRYLKPVSSFRSRYAYDNLLYMVAGQIIPKVTGKSWEEFVEGRIFAPLRMQPCAASYSRISDRRNVASPHVAIDGKVRAIPVVKMDVIGPAGTINCSINATAKWIETQLSAGREPDGDQLFSSDRSAEMWTMNTVTPVGSPTDAMYRTNFSGYALGWDVSDVLGHKRVAHTGAVSGGTTWITMIPELKLGILVFTNEGSGIAMTAVGNQILDAYLGAPKRDWVSIAKAYVSRRQGVADAAVEAVANKLATAPAPLLPLDAYAGRYVDSWRGSADVRRDGNRLFLKFSRTSQLEGALLPYQGNTFVVRWNDRSLDADAFVRFEQGFDGKITGITMRPVSPSTDFSFDFQDLDLRRDSGDRPH